MRLGALLLLRARRESIMEVFHPPIYESGATTMMDSLLALSSKSAPKRNASARAMTQR